MKKQWAILACLMLGATAVSVAGCDFLPQSDHQASQDSITNQINGISSLEESSSDVASAESEVDSTSEEVHVHGWDAGQVTIEVGCETAGEMKYSCVCGASYTASITAIGHSYTNYIPNGDASCRADGTKTAVCDNGCGARNTITDGGSVSEHHFEGQNCVDCGVWLESEGLWYELNADQASYCVHGIMSCEDSIIVIPSSYENLPVTVIGGSAFYACTDLLGVIIPDSVTTIGVFAFAGCSNLTNISIPDSVTAIGDSAFNECSNLTNLDLSDNLVSIGDYAFNGCNKLTAVAFPDSVTSLGNGAFQDCTNLAAVDFTDHILTIGEWCFYNCTNLTNITLPKNITEISSYAFNNCTSLANVEIPQAVTRIGASAFYGCDTFTSIVIPDSVTVIEEYAFQSCDGLLHATLGKNVETIGKMAFYYCLNLKGVVVPKSVTVIGDDAFNAATLGVVYCEAETQPDGWSDRWAGRVAVEKVWGYTYVWSDNVVYGIKDGVAVVVLQPGYGFMEIRIAANVVYGGQTYPVTTIEKGAFDGSGQYSRHRDLTKVVIGENISLIKQAAFYSCENLTTVEIPATVTGLEKYAFTLCDNLTVYCEATEKPDGWNQLWAWSDIEIVWGYKNTNA